MAEEKKRVDDDDFFTTLKKTVAENVYFDYEENEQKKIEQTNPTSSTFRVDSSDLISRCRTFLPLLTDANRILFSKIQSGENVRIELDSESESDEDEEEKQQIEMNLMFCPDDDDESSSSDDEILPTTIKNSSEKKIIEIDSTDKEDQ